jgi:polysaccharide export outer membrane protein
MRYLTTLTVIARQLAFLGLLFSFLYLSVAAQERPILNLPDRYRLQSGDVVEIQYRLSPEYNDTVTVQPDGYITLTMIGDLKIGGLTLDQTRAAILEKARVKLRDPELNIKLREFERLYVTVFGEVDKPGRIELHGAMTAVEALAAAGGFRDSAKHSQIILFRKVSADWAEAREIDLKQSLAKRNLAEDLNLRPGDLLYVPQNRISKVERLMKLVSLSYPLSILVRR